MKTVKRPSCSCLLPVRSGPLLLLSLVAGLWTFSGCSQDAAIPASSDQTNSNPVPAVDGAKFLLATEPNGATDVITVREEAKDQDEVVIVGRIGGSENPWVDGRAAFSIVDPSLKSCLECGSMGCPKPWDYC